MKSDLLQATRVVDLTGREAWDCGRLLASIGAEVVRVDLPAATIDDDWRFGNADKRCVTIDYETSAGRTDLAALIAASDLVLESFAPGRMEALGLGFERLQAAHPDLVLVSITPFGQTGPHAHYKDGELIVAALSGLMSVNGYADRAPLKEAGHAIWYHASMAAAAAGVFALYNARQGGGGQQVDISAQEVSATRNVTWLMKHQFDGLRPSRFGPFLNTGLGPNRAIWELRDGYSISPMGPPGSPVHTAIGKWMADLGYPDPYDGNPPPPGRPDPANAQKWSKAMEAFLKDRTRAELMSEGIKRGANILTVNEPRDLIGDPQFSARGFFAPVEGASDPLQFPQWFALTNDTDKQPVRLPDAPKPLAGAPDAVFASRPARPKPAPAARTLPLAGVKVLDFSWAIVGNTGAKMMGDLGAEIAKIETAKRIGIERTLPIVRNVPWDKSPDASPWYAHIATSKKSITVDLSAPLSRKLIDAMVDWADIVFENFAPGVMDRLGLGYEALKARKPSIIMASGSIFGQTGPMGNFPGTDLTGAGRSGRIAMTGDPDRTPVLPSATYGDSVVPYAMTAAMIAALMRRDETGQGCRIDTSMTEIIAQQQLPEIIAAQRDMARGGSGEILRIGNKARDAAPHDVFPAKGEDAWIAIDARAEADFARLCAVMGQPDLPNDARFATAVARKANEAALEAIIAGFTRTLDPWEGMEVLQAAGVPAAAVQRPGDVADRDAQMAHRTYLQPVAHPVLGTFGHQRTPMGFSKTPPRMFHAPTLGQHNQEIAREVGLSQDDFDALTAAGVFV